MDKAPCENQKTEHRHNHHDAHLNEHIAESKLAWTLWNSHSQEDWDRAMDIKERMVKTDPTAWKIAMKQIDNEEANLPRMELHDDRQAMNGRAGYVPADVMPVQPREQMQPPVPLPSPPPEVPPQMVHPGYAPQSAYAPAVPNSPAYEAAYNMPPAHFYGVDLGIVRLGVNDRGSVEAGVNVGIAKAGVQAGMYNRVDGEFMPYGGPVHARAGAGIGIDGERGLHSEVGAGANFFNVVNGDADFGAAVNRDISTYGDVRGKVWPVQAQGEAGASVGASGADAYTGGNVGIDSVAGVRSGGEVALGNRSRVAAGVGVTGGNEALDLGPDLELNGGTADGGALNLNTRPLHAPTFYPTGDRSQD